MIDRSDETSQPPPRDSTWTRLKALLGVLFGD